MIKRSKKAVLIMQWKIEKVLYFFEITLNQSAIISQGQPLYQIQLIVQQKSIDST